MTHGGKFLGSIAEDVVAAQLAQRGWSILSRNYRRHGFEVDIIVRKAATIVAVEVKYRAATQPIEIDASSLLPRKKVARIYRGLQHFLMQAHLDSWDVLRVDLAMVTNVTPPRIRYFVDAGGALD